MSNTYVIAGASNSQAAPQQYSSCVYIIAGILVHSDCTSAVQMQCLWHHSAPCTHLCSTPLQYASRAYHTTPRTVKLLLCSTAAMFMLSHSFLYAPLQHSCSVSSSQGSSYAPLQYSCIYFFTQGSSYAPQQYTSSVCVSRKAPPTVESHLSSTIGSFCVNTVRLVRTTHLSSTTVAFVSLQGSSYSQAAPQQYSSGGGYGGGYGGDGITMGFPETSVPAFSSQVRRTSNPISFFGLSLWFD